MILKCSKCGGDVERMYFHDVATCFDCKIQMRKERNALRAPEIKLKRAEYWKRDSVKKMRAEASKRFRARKAAKTAASL